MPELPILQRVGAYTLIRSAGSTAYSQIYDSLHPSSGMRVRVEVFASDFAKMADFKQRFRTQLQAAQKVEHPHVVKVLDGDVDESGHPYIVSEVVEGQTLAEMFSSGIRMDYGQSVQWLSEIGGALDALHKAATVHRDLRPASIIITSSQTARLTHLGRGGLLPLEQFRLTREVMIGSPMYMAPEVALGQLFTASADMYSWGCLAFHMLSGQTPYPLGSADDVMRFHATSAIPKLTDIKPDIGAEVSEIISEAMAKAPSSRYKNMDILLLDWNAVAKKSTPRKPGGAPGQGVSTGMGMGAATANRLSLAVTGSAPIIDEPEDSYIVGSTAKPATGATPLKLKVADDEPIRPTGFTPAFSDVPGMGSTIPKVNLPESSSLGVADDLAAIMPKKVAGGMIDSAIAAPQPGQLNRIPTGDNPRGEFRDIYGRTDRQSTGRLRAHNTADEKGGNLFLILGIIVFLAVAGALGFAWQQGALQRMFTDPAALAAEAELREAWQKHRTTVTRIQQLPYKIIPYEQAEYRKPSSMDDLVRSGFATRNEVMDAYGRDLIYDSVNNEIISLGADGTRNTSDDFVFSVERTRWVRQPVEPDYNPSPSEESEINNLGRN